MNDLTKLDQWHERLAKAARAIQQPRTDFELAHFVVGQHDTEPRRWVQCVLELQIKVQTLRRAKIAERQMRRRIRKLERKGTRKAVDKAKLMRIDLEDHEMAILGATREARALWTIYKGFSRAYSRRQLNGSEEEYWRRRLARQALQDANATGRIGVGNQDALRMLGSPTDAPSETVGAIERRFLNVGGTRLLVAIPTLISREEIARDGMKCLHGWRVPGTFEHRLLVEHGKSVADAYNHAAATSLQDGAEFMLSVEDDHIVPAGTIEKIWQLYCASDPRSIVGAWYPQRLDPRTGSPIVVVDRRRAFLSDDGAVHEVYSIPQGFTLIPTRVFEELEPPWFVSTPSLTQDSYFSQRAREIGYRLLVDTSARIKHVDRDTGRIYE
jgi:hypothetical protein